MKKNLKICPLYIATAMILCACGLYAADEATGATENPSAVVVAEVDGVPIYKDLYNLHYKNFKEGLRSNRIVVTDEELSNMVLDFLIDPIVLQHKLKELGYYEMTEQRQAQVDDYIQIEIDYYLIQEYLGPKYTEENLKAARASYQNEVINKYFYGLTLEKLTEVYLPRVAEDAAKEDIVGEIIPTDEQVRKHYDERIADLKQLYKEDATKYVSAVLNGYEMIYIPDGVRRVRQVLIPLNEKVRAEDVLSRLQLGEITFDEALEEYPDESMPERGYPVVAGDDNYTAEFTKAALGLANIGDITGLNKTDLGYCILQYYAHESEGAVPLESVYDILYEGAMNELTEKAWTIVVNGWREGMNAIIFKENLN